MRILILGGTGFIGPHVVRRLAGEGHAVAVFHRGPRPPDLPEEVAEIRGDRRDLASYGSLLRSFAPDVAVDMFPITEADARSFVNSFRGLAGRCVAISSQDVYRAYGRLTGREPGPPDPVPLAEDAPLRERLYPYREQFEDADDERSRRLRDYDKILIERVVLGEPAIRGAILRLPMVYGPGDRQHRLFEYLVRMDAGREAILLDERLAGWRWTHGYVEDIADAIALAATDERAAGRVFNVGEPEALTRVEWIHRIGAAAGWTGRVVTAPSARLPRNLRAEIDPHQHLVTDSGRIRRELGYRETVPPETALERTVAWERGHPPSSAGAEAPDFPAEDAVLADLAQEDG